MCTHRYFSLVNMFNAIVLLGRYFVCFYVGVLVCWFSGSQFVLLLLRYTCWRIERAQKCITPPNSLSACPKQEPVIKLLSLVNDCHTLGLCPRRSVTHVRPVCPYVQKKTWFPFFSLILPLTNVVKLKHKSTKKTQIRFDIPIDY